MMLLDCPPAKVFMGCTGSLTRRLTIIRHYRSSFGCPRLQETQGATRRHKIRRNHPRTPRPGYDGCAPGIGHFAWCLPLRSHPPAARTRADVEGEVTWRPMPNGQRDKMQRAKTN